MSRSLTSPRHAALAEFLIEKRIAAGLTQAEVAKGIGRYQSYISDIEAGQRRVDVVMLIELAQVIGFDPKEAIEQMK